MVVPLWTAAVFPMMTSASAISRWCSPGDESEDLRLARRQAEDLLKVVLPGRRSRVRRHEIEPRTSGEPFELVGRRLCSDGSCDRLRLPERARGARQGW
jgi:hypothetical protein